MAEDILSTEDREQIVRAIKNAELNTSGEIRVHIENHCKGEVLDRAAEVFDILKLQKTELRNGVLFYLALKDQKFAILGDSGINRSVPADFWDEIKLHMSDHFKANRIADALSEGITMAGDQLKKHFPHKKGDINELSDDISFGKN